MRIPDKFVSLTSQYGVFSAVQYLVMDFIKFILPFIPLVISLGVLSLYGAKFGEDKKMGILSCLIPTVIGLFYVGISTTLVLLSIGVIFAGFISTGLSEAYFRELKKWKRYRTGSNTVGKVLLVINILIFLGLFLTSLYSINYYSNSYKNETKNILESIISPITSNEMNTNEIPGYKSLTEEQKQLIQQQYQEQLSKQKDLVNSKIDEMLNSEKISALIYLSVLSMPFIVFGLLEILRTLVFSPIAGIITGIGLREVKVS